MTMGYSYAAKAGYVLTALQAVVDREWPNPVSNALPNGFWETGKENADGAITGTVWRTVKKLTDEERKAEAIKRGCADHPDWIGDPCRRAGSFRIEATGKIKRFPTIPAAWRAEAERTGAERFREVHGEW
jgi:hypothetical protein